MSTYGYFGGGIARGIARGLTARQSAKERAAQNLINVYGLLRQVEPEEEDVFKSLISEATGGDIQFSPGFRVPRGPRPFMQRRASEVFQPDELQGLPLDVSVGDAMTLNPRLSEKYAPWMRAEREKGEAGAARTQTERDLDQWLKFNPNRPLPADLAARLKQHNIPVPLRSASEEIARPTGRDPKAGEPDVSTIERPELGQVVDIQQASEVVTVIDKRGRMIAQYRVPAGSKVQVVEGDPAEGGGMKKVAIFDHRGNLVRTIDLPQGTEVRMLGTPSGAGSTNWTPQQIANLRRAAFDQARQEAEGYLINPPWKTPQERAQWIEQRASALVQGWMGTTSAAPAETGDYRLSADEQAFLGQFGSWDDAVKANPGLAQAPANMQAAAQAYYASRPSAQRAPRPPVIKREPKKHLSEMRQKVEQAARTGEPFPDAYLRQKGYTQAEIDLLRTAYDRTKKKG